jgi:membrane associated rhomboid family serine protease
MVAAWVGVFCAVSALLAVLPAAQAHWLAVAMAFIPARLGEAAGDLPGGQVAIVTAFFTHVFVHADLPHLIVNSAWFLAFATPVYSRTGPLRFTAFFFLAGIGGAFFFLLVNGTIMALLIGASGAISGLMGAALRFLFGTSSQGALPTLNRTGNPAPLIPLAGILRHRRLALTIIVWTVLNVVLAWGLAGLTSAGAIAWEAHLGGFYMGLASYGLFDHPAPLEPSPIKGDGEDDAADAL